MQIGRPRKKDNQLRAYWREAKKRAKLKERKTTVQSDPNKETQPINKNISEKEAA